MAVAIEHLRRDLAPFSRYRGGLPLQVLLRFCARSEGAVLRLVEWRRLAHAGRAVVELRRRLRNLSALVPGYECGRRRRSARHHCAPTLPGRPRDRRNLDLPDLSLAHGRFR